MRLWLLLCWLTLMHLLRMLLSFALFLFSSQEPQQQPDSFCICFFLQDEATVRELAADERGDMKGWLQRLHAWLFEGDIFASVASNDVLLRIHSTAEKFEGAAEDCFVPQQVL